jgi:hypothetical protein
MIAVELTAFQRSVGRVAPDLGREYNAGESGTQTPAGAPGLALFETWGSSLCVYRANNLRRLPLQQNHGHDSCNITLAPIDLQRRNKGVVGLYDFHRSSEVR